MTEAVIDPAAGAVVGAPAAGAPPSAVGHGPPPAAERVIPQIVPVKGLPFAALVVAFLILSILENWHWAIDWFHVVGGGLWTAIDLFVGFVIGPILGRLSPQARAEFSARFMPKMVLLMPVLVTMTLASGWQLARDLGNLTVPYPKHWWIVTSMIVVAVMAIVAFGLLEPANLGVLFEMRKPEPDIALIAALMKRFLYTAGVTGVMQVATLVVMTRIATW
jgi:hypothetical protein